MRHGEPNHTCRICGKPYFACDTCDAKIGKTWRAVTCTAEHYDVFLALWKYNYGQMSEDGIKQILTEAKANTWTGSPSYELIISLIGEPKEEDEAEDTHDDGHDVTENVVYASDHVEHEAKNAEHAVVEDIEKGEVPHEDVPAFKSVKKNYSNGNYRNKKRHR